MRRAAIRVQPENMNLGVIPNYISDAAQRFGYRRHTIMVLFCLVEQTARARVLEKYYAEQDLKGTDHAFSLTPEALRKLIRDLVTCS